jgi:hypothetical protein
MAERVLKVKTVSEVAESIAGLTELGGSLRGVGTAAFEAAGKSKGAWKELEAEWVKATGSAKGVADAAFRTESALNAMGRAGSLSQLESGLVKSMVELDRLKAKLEEVRAAGGQIDEGIAAAVAAMEASVAAGQRKFADLAASTAKARETLKGLAGEAAGVAKGVGAVGQASQGAAVATGKLDANTSQLAKSVLSASGIVGPYGEMLERLSVSGGGAAASLASLAFKAAGFAAAAKLGWEAGEKLDAKLKEIGIDLADPITALEKLEEALRRTPEAASDSATSIGEVATGVRNLKVGLASIPEPAKKFVLDLIDLAKGARDASGKIGALTADIDLESDALTDHTKALAGQVVARRAFLNEVERTSGTFKSAMPGWVDAAQRAKDLAGEIHAAEIKLREIERAGGDWRKEIEANQEPFQRWVDSLREGNVTLESLPAPVREAIAYLDSLAKKHDDGAAAARRHADAEEAAAKRAAENARNANRSGAPVTRPADPNAREGQRVIQETTEGLQRQADALDEVADAAMRSQIAWEEAGKARRETTTATEQAERVERGFGTSLDYVAQKVAENNGTLVVGESILLNLAAAEDRVVQALYRRLEATKLLTAAQMESLGVAEGWLAYIANIEDSMARGITSTTVGINLLADLQRQLQTFYANASGEAKKTIDDVTNAIRALIATATGGGVLDVSPLGNLEREIERKKKRGR